MTIDALALAALTNEIATYAVGARVQKIFMTGPLGLVMEVYAAQIRQRRQMLASVDPQNARMHLLAPGHKATAMPGDATPFALMLRKYVRNGFITAIDQMPLERVVTLSIAKNMAPDKLPGATGKAYLTAEDVAEQDEDDDSGDPALDNSIAAIGPMAAPGQVTVRTQLICEIMGRYSNIILVDQATGQIMDALKRLPPSKNRYRAILPHVPYIAPPPQSTKRNPIRDTGSPSAFDRMMRDLAKPPTPGAPKTDADKSGVGPTTPVWQALVQVFTAVSPQLAREALYRTARARHGEDVEAAGRTAQSAVMATFSGWPRLASEVRHLFDTVLGPERSVQWAGLSAVAQGDAPNLPGQNSDREKPSVVREVPELDDDDSVLDVTGLAADEGGEIIAFAPYALRQFEPRGLNFESVDLLGAAVDEFYAQVETLGGQVQRKRELAAPLEEQRDRLVRRVASMEEQLSKAAAAEVLRRSGEAIYANLWQIQPGATELRVTEDIDSQGNTAEFVVALDTNLSASENAQKYFRDYQKARGAMEDLPALLEDARLKLRYIDEMLTQIELAETFGELSQLKSEMKATGAYTISSVEPNAARQERAETLAKPAKGQQPVVKKGGAGNPNQAKAKAAAARARANGNRRKGGSEPRRFTTRDGLTVYVGRSAVDNERVSFEYGDRGDLWLHARGVPGSHVVLKMAGRDISDVPERSLVEAAELAAYYSKARNNTRAEVDYAPQKNIRKIKGAPPGLVTLTGERTLRVRPRNPTEMPEGDEDVDYEEYTVAPGS